MIMYRVVAGRLPFESDGVPNLVRLMDEATPSLGAPRGFPANLAEVVDACLSKRPEHRPESVRAVLEWLHPQTVRDTTSQWQLHRQAPDDAARNRSGRRRGTTWVWL